MREQLQIPREPRDSERTSEHGSYPWLVLAVLVLAYTLSYVDRQALTLMVDPIRDSLGISDTQISLLHGLAFALFYTLMGIPIGRLVDNGRRVRIIALGIVAWSLMTALCGLARNFTQMFFARIGVGIGEAALSPAAYSLLADWFEPRRLPIALSIYSGAAQVGAGLATIIGGALIAAMPALSLPAVGHLEPWQGVFLVIGLPGASVALLVLLLREPPRRGVKHGVEPSFAALTRQLAQHRGIYLAVMTGYSLLALVWNGTAAWLPTYFMRGFGWSAAEVGLRYGLTLLVGGALGVLAGGLVASAWRSRGRIDANVRVGLLGVGIALPAGLFAMTTNDEWAALMAVFVFSFACSSPFGAAVAALQEITPNQLRGQVSALYLLATNLIGIGLGPTVTALFTDRVFASDTALSQSMISVIILFTPLAGLILWLSCRPYRRTLAAVDF